MNSLPSLSSTPLQSRHTETSRHGHGIQTTRPRSITASAGRSPLETRIELVSALAVMASSAAWRVGTELGGEVWRYAFPRRIGSRNLEEALMSVPNLESVRFNLLKQMEKYDIREVEPYFIAETEMLGSSGFDFNGASQAFNVLAGYLFGKNIETEAMEMTTPVYTRRVESGGEKMDMTTVITKKSGDKNNWKMSFVMPSKYGPNLPVPVDPSVKIREVPRKIVAVAAFSGFVTDGEVINREAELREALESDPEYHVKPNAFIEVAQFNPPFTLPFMRRNEVSLEVERKND